MISKENNKQDYGQKDKLKIIQHTEGQAEAVKGRSLMTIGNDSTSATANKLNVITLYICKSIAKRTGQAAVCDDCRHDDL